MNMYKYNAHAQVKGEGIVESAVRKRLDTKLIVMVTRDQHLKMTRAAKKQMVSLGEYVRRILKQEIEK